MIEVVDTSGSLLQKLAASMTLDGSQRRGWEARCLSPTGEFVKSNLNLKGGIAVFLVHLQVAIGDKRDLLVWGLGTQNIPFKRVSITTSFFSAGLKRVLTQAHVLEALLLPNVVIIGNVDAGGDSRAYITRLGTGRAVEGARIDVPQKVSTSRDVKSGDRNLSFSNSFDHGNKGIREGAFFTRSPKDFVRSTVL